MGEGPPPPPRMKSAPICGPRREPFGVPLAVAMLQNLVDAKTMKYHALTAARDAAFDAWRRYAATDMGHLTGKDLRPDEVELIGGPTS